MDALFDHHPPEGEPLPLVVSIPHSGTFVPLEIARGFAGPEIEALPDTDFHLERLYDFASALGAEVLVARTSRYVVDLNRPRDGAPLYPGRAETEVVPTRSFAGAPIWRPGREPDQKEREERLGAFWDPYHRELRRILERLRERHGYALLFDAHSIRGEVPRLVQGRLPDLMLGSAGGRSCDPRIRDAVREVLENGGYDFRLDDPFRGGYITRGYGRPSEGVHALQLEMSQRIYMEEDPPWTYREDRAAALRPLLRRALETFAAEARAHL